MDGDSSPFVNPLLEVSDFDSAAGKPMVLCALPSAGEPVRFALPKTYMDLIREFDGGKNIDQAIDGFLERNSGSYEREWLLRLVNESLIPKGLLVYSHQDPACVAVSSQPSRAFFYIKLPIIKPDVVDPIAQHLKFLFKPLALALGLLLFIASHIYVYGVLLGQQSVNFNELNAGSILILMLLSTVGTVFHEFGHASAAAHYGCRRMTIGWGLYIIYTVLWTNVSDAWKLPRRQRVVVDIGGVHFESLFLLLMLALYMYTGNSIFLFAFVFIDLSIATTFNPFLRMDGYWLMSDLFGIVNLRNQQVLWLRNIASRWFGDGSQTSESDLSRKAKWALGIYTVLGIFFLAYIFKVIYEVVILSIVTAYPGMVGDLWTSIQTGMNGFDILGAVVELFWRGLVIFGAIVTLYSFAKGGLRLFGELLTARLGLASGKS